MKHQFAIPLSPAHWPTAIQVWPDIGLGDGTGDGDGEGIGDGTGEGGGIVIGGNVGKTKGSPPIEMSAQDLNVS